MSTINTILWDADGVLLDHDSNPNQDLLELIAGLRARHGIRSLLATNQHTERMEYIRTELGFAEVLDGLYASCELGVEKPSTQFYISILEQEYAAGYENPLDQVLYFDDKEENIAVARELGIHAYLFQDNSDAIDALRQHRLL